MVASRIYVTTSRDNLEQLTGDHDSITLSLPNLAAILSLVSQNAFYFM